MTRLAVVVAVLAAAAPAALAQPPCNVVIARAPDAARAEIERWIAAEPRCARGLELRVVDTPDGLYLFARDDRGFTRDRVVPDAATAGALVASWIADDSVDGVWMNPPDLAPHGVAPVAVPFAAQPTVYEDRGHRLRTAGISAIAIGGALIAVGLYEGHQASQISAEIDAHPVGTPWPADIAALEHRGQRAEQLEYVLLGTGVAAVIGGTTAYLFGRARAHTERVLVVPTASAQGAGVGLTGSF